jgi:hypothetical protein
VQLNKRNAAFVVLQIRKNLNLVHQDSEIVEQQLVTVLALAKDST